MRVIYTILLYLLLPLIFLRLLWRSRKQPGYRKRLGERFGCFPSTLPQSIWVHAVSVGETIAAMPLIHALKNRYPHIPLLVTTMTPTGSERLLSLLGDSVTHVYLPYDFPFAIKRFLSTYRPMMAIIMETELWPNVLHVCQTQHVPVCLLNARMSQKSMRGYQRIASLMRKMLSELTMIAANSEADATRFIELGATKNQIVVTGNIKFDLEIPSDLMEHATLLRKTLEKNHPFIWIAASTHEGEEEIILKAHQQIRELNPHALLILVPRHPDRFNFVATLCARYGNVARRRLHETVTENTAIYLADTMGELMRMYAVSDVAFIGGSLVKRGGHNLLEPAALGKPLVTGEHLFNFLTISKLFLSAQALIKIQDADSLANTMIHLMQDESLRHELGQRARCVVDDNRGALDKQMDVINKILKIH